MNKNYKDIQTIRQDWDDGKYHVPEEMYVHEKKLPDDYIFDEDLSVKQNREMVHNYNNSIDIRKKAYRDEANRLSRQLTEDVINYLMDEYGFIRKQAEKIESRAYEKYHSCMSDYFSGVDDLAEFIIEIKLTF